MHTRTHIQIIIYNYNADYFMCNFYTIFTSKGCDVIRSGSIGRASGFMGVFYLCVFLRLHTH